MSMKFRSIPIIIEAFRYNIDPRPDWFQDEVTKNTILTYEDHCIMKLPGTDEERVGVGEYII